MDSYEKVIAVVKKYTGQNTKYNIEHKIQYLGTIVSYNHSKYICKY